MWHFFRLYWPWLVRISCSVYFLKARRCESCLFLYALERLLDLQCIPSRCKEASISTFPVLHLLVPVGTQCPGAEITQIVVSREAKKPLTVARSQLHTPMCSVHSALVWQLSMLSLCVCVSTFQLWKKSLFFFSKRLQPSIREQTVNNNNKWTRILALV